MDRRAIIVSLAVLAGVLVPGAALVELREGLDRAERRRAAADVAAATALTLERQLSGSLAGAHALAAVVRQAGGVRDFERLAAELYQLYPGLDSLQLAPDAVLRHIYPLAGNEAALGLDLAHDPVHGPDVEAARATGRLVLAGPFALKQGGIGLAGRVAVFVRHGDEERFWGIASALVRLPRLLETSRIGMLSEAGYDYELNRTGRSGSVEVIARDWKRPGPFDRPVSMAIRVPNGEWTLEVAPRQGWGRPGQRAFGYALVLAAGLTFAALAYRVLRQPALLRREVAARTAELEKALRDQRATEEALRQAQKMEAIGRLAGGIAHDFNNMLHVILGYTGAAAASPDLPPRLRDDLQQAIGAADRAAALTRQLLAFGRRQVLEPARLDVNEVIANLVRMLTPIIGEHIALRVVPGRDLGPVWADRGQVEQVLLNLCVNARDAMPGGGTLTIATENAVADGGGAHPGVPPGRYVLLGVTDTGTGIAPELIEHVFEPFFTTKEMGKGTGLGLATIHGIVHQHRGVIQVRSEVGRGSTFEVYLPSIESA